MAEPSSAASTLADQLRALWRRRLLVVGVVVLAIVASLALSLTTDATYEAESTVRITQTNEESVFAGDTPDPAANRAREIVTEIEVLKSPAMREAVVDQLGDEARSFVGVRVRAVPYSDVIEITTTARVPAVAASAANSFAQLFVDQRREQAVEALVSKSAELRGRAEDAREQLTAIDGRLSDPALDPAVAETLRLDRQFLAGQIQEYDRRADELEVESALREGGTRIVSEARAQSEPVSPKPLRSAVIAAVLGALLGVAIALIVDSLDDTVTDSTELAALHPSITTLAVVPHGDVLGQLDADVGVLAEAYRYLRTSLRFATLDSDVRRILVTSAVAGEGKTTTAVNLALSLARSGTTVALVDCDFRHPQVHERLGVSDERGLSSILQGKDSMSRSVLTPIENLTLITAGPPVSSPMDVLDTPRLEGLFQSLETSHEIVIVDVPPVLPVADALVVGGAVHAAVFVGRVGRVRRREVRGALHKLAEARLPVVGVVANDTDAKLTPYGYAGSRATAVGTPT